MMNTIVRKLCNKICCLFMDLGQYSVNVQGMIFIFHNLPNSDFTMGMSSRKICYSILGVILCALFLIFSNDSYDLKNIATVNQRLPAYEYNSDLIAKDFKVRAGRLHSDCS